jgi:hypothetical protein
MEFKDALNLVSPKETGQKVKDAHWLLSGHNVFKQDFHAGPDDGVYGPQMAGATKRAKYYLGYPQKNVDTSFGQYIYQFLLPEKDPNHKKLSRAYSWRRSQRLKKAVKVKSIKEKATDAARVDAKNQVHESPAGSNLTMFGAWFGINPARWCAIYVTYRLVMAGAKDFIRGKFASYVGAFVEEARHGHRHLALTSNPEYGDIVCYAGDVHTAFFVEWTDRKNGAFRDVGGNTSSHDGSPSNGGEVAENIRYTHGSFPATAFIRVGS